MYLFIYLFIYPLFYCYITCDAYLLCMQALLNKSISDCYDNKHNRTVVREYLISKCMQ